MQPMAQKQFARHLRKCQNTYEELLRQLLRNRRRCNKKFRRQHAIAIYVADFYCAEDKLIVEIDGRDHFTEQGEFMMKPVIVLCTRKAFECYALQVSKLRLNQNGC